jgi:hypothetical protein
VSITILYIGEFFASPSDGTDTYKEKMDFFLKLCFYFMQFQNLAIFEMSCLAIGPVMGVMEVVVRRGIGNKITISYTQFEHMNASFYLLVFSF